MKKAFAIDFLKTLLAKVPNSQPRAGWVISTCPLGPWRHDDGKSADEVFGIRVKDQGDSFCNCFSCGYHGLLSDLVLDMKLHNKLRPHHDYDWKKVVHLIAQAEEDLELDFEPDEEKLGPHVFPEWWIDSFGRPGDHQWAIDYLIERNVGPEVAGALDLYVDNKEKRICFPVRGKDKLLYGLHGRVIDKHTEPRYRMYVQAGRNNPDFWLGEDRINPDKPMIVVEGPFDLASVFRVYRNVSAPLFSTPSQQKLRRMGDCLEWITLFDHGKGGDTGRQRVTKTMKEQLVTHLKPPDDCKDPGDMSIQQLIELLEDHVDLDPILD